MIPLQRALQMYSRSKAVLVRLVVPSSPWFHLKLQQSRVGTRAAVSCTPAASSQPKMLPAKVIRSRTVHLSKISDGAAGNIQAKEQVKCELTTLRAEMVPTVLAAACILLHRDLSGDSRALDAQPDRSVATHTSSCSSSHRLSRE